MKDHLISLFIDDELDLNEKIDFVETVHDDSAYKTEAIGMLYQEKQLRDDPAKIVPPVADLQAQRRRFPAWLNPIVYGLGFVGLFFILWHAVIPGSDMEAQPLFKSHRFVIFRPDISRVEISGTFTGWQPQVMTRIGDSGYWEAEFELSMGEHRFAFILEGNQRMVDPTIQAREKDDFGGENSILSVSL